MKDQVKTNKAQNLEVMFEKRSCWDMHMEHTATSGTSTAQDAAVKEALSSSV